MSAAGAAETAAMPARPASLVNILEGLREGVVCVWGVRGDEVEGAE